MKIPPKQQILIIRQTARRHARDYANGCIAAVGSTVKEWNPYWLTDFIREIAETKKFQRVGKIVLKAVEEITLPADTIRKLEKLKRK